MFYQFKTLIVIEGLLLIGLFLFRAALVRSRRDVVDTRAIVLMLLIPAVALLCRSVYIYYAFLTVAVAFSARSRAELASIYILILPMTPMLSIETGFGGVYIAALSTLLFMNLGALIGLMVTARRKPVPARRYDAAALLLLALFMYIYVRDASVTGALRLLLVQGLSVLAPYLLVSRGLATRAEVERFLLRFVLGGTLTAVVAVFQAAKHWVPYQAFNEVLDVPVGLQSATLSLRAGMLRTGGPLVDYTAGGLFLATVLVTMPALRGHFRQSLFWPLVGGLVAGLLATQSRGAWAAALVGFCFLFVLRGRLAWALGLVGAAVAAELAILAFATRGKLAAILGASSEATGTIDYRQKLLSRGLEEVARHPLAGVPQNRLVADLSDLMQGQHIVDFVNSHLFIAMAAGVPLFLGWLGAWFLPVIDGFARRKTDPDARRFAEVPATIVVTVMVGLFATSLIDRNLTWALVALGLAAPCYRLARQETKSTVRPRAVLRRSESGAASAAGAPIVARVPDRASLTAP